MEVNLKGIASKNVGKTELDKVEAYHALKPHSEVGYDRGGNKSGLFWPVSIVEMSELAKMQDFDDFMKQASNKSLFMESS